MKNVKLLLIVLVVVGFSFGSVNMVFSGGADKGPESIAIGVASEKYQPAQFSHKKHQDEIVKGDCKKCHHEYKEGVKPEKCTGCHTKAGDPKGAGKIAKEVFHATCKDCHKEQKTAGNVKAETGCTFCHQKLAK